MRFVLARGMWVARVALPAVARGVLVAAFVVPALFASPKPVDAVRFRPHEDFLRVYVNNIENLATADAACPGDWRDLVYYMRVSGAAPDVFLVQQVDYAEAAELAGFMEQQLDRDYDFVLSPRPVGNRMRTCRGEKAIQRNAVVYRTDRLTLLSTGSWQASHLIRGACRPNDQDRTVAIRATFEDRRSDRRVAVASVHWPTAAKKGPACAEVNARQVADQMSRVPADLKIVGGDLNVGDLETPSTASRYRGWYAQLNDDLAPRLLGFRDAIFDECDETRIAIKGCLVDDHHTLGPKRYDFLFARRGGPLLPKVGAEHTVSLAEADAADVQVTGDDHEDNYSVHRAVRARVFYTVE